MINRKFLSKLAITALIPLIAITSLETKAKAQEMLQPGSTVDGVINATSKMFAYGDKTRYGNEYSLSVSAGDYIDINAIREEGSSLDIVITVIDPTGQEKIIDQDTQSGRLEYFRTKSPLAGSWTVRIVSWNNKPGRYKMSLVIYDAANNPKVPKEPEKPLSLADQVMKNYSLPSVPCGSPNLAVIKIGADQRCTTGYPKGVYTYDVATKTLIEEQPADPNLALIKSWGLNILPSCSGQVAVISIDRKQYCTVPDQGLRAGQYTYDRTADRLISASPEPDKVTPTPPEQNPIPTPNPEPSDRGF